MGEGVGCNMGGTTIRCGVYMNSISMKSTGGCVNNLVYGSIFQCAGNIRLDLQIHKHHLLLTSRESNLFMPTGMCAFYNVAIIS